MPTAKAAPNKKRIIARGPVKPAAKAPKKTAKSLSTATSAPKAAHSSKAGTSTAAKSGSKVAAPLKGKKSLAAPGKAGGTQSVQLTPAAFPKGNKEKSGARVSRRSISPVYAGRGQSAAGDSVCREVACEGLATAAGYCRLHYIKNWKKIKRKELILKERKLNQYIEELVVKYPDKYLEAIRNDLANDKEFAMVIKDLDLDESIEEFTEGEGEADDGVIEGIRRDFDDTEEGF